jgi:hypothetical protein
MFQNLGMNKPQLIDYAEKYHINPLLNHGEKGILTAIFKALQEIGKEMVDWVMEVRWQNLERGGLLWNFKQPGFNGFVSDTPALPPLEIQPLALMDVDSGAFIEDKTDRMVEDIDETGLHMVLHPKESHFTQRYPGFDAFKAQPLTNNGYVEDY